MSTEIPIRVKEEEKQPLTPATAKINSPEDNVTKEGNNEQSSTTTTTTTTTTTSSSSSSSSPPNNDLKKGTTTTTSESTKTTPTNSKTSTSTNDKENSTNKRKKVGVACVYCRRSHMICDSERPCQRCIKRNIGHLCHDELPASKMKKGKSSLQNIISNNTLVSSASSDRLKTLGIYSQNSQTDYANNSNNNDTIVGQRLGYGLPSQQMATTGPPTPQLQQSGSSTAINQQPFFYSEHAGSEFNSLTEFLSMIDDTDMINTINLNNDPMLHKLEAYNNNGNSNNNSSTNLNAQNFETNLFANNNSAGGSSTPIAPQLTKKPSGPATSPAPQQQQQQQQQQPPYVSDSARDKFFLTAADPTTEISPEERLKQVINAKLEAGLLKPYNYAKGYQRLQTYMDNHMASSSRQRILKPLSTFRPGFRAIAKTLKDLDLILVEENFERMLLDYDRVFTSMAIPACLWRRTGEIYRGNKEFASLVDVSIDDLKNGKLTVYELMTEESSVNFWEKYGAIAFDKTQKAVLTSCNLRTKDGRKKKNCCFSFTIRRDRYNIPSCIVGNFIPIQ
ncbi:hypothetical protein CANARDRAFT_204750 [[Candida] arabinofermentans NRRL YB-2248]|uniref:Zn(2)-C6 fungal-type domain-containing protein n=1 Tax=[Candida] arabinofermentans NRRL YB-2248 TaxID=983967 RepID=A0A1E4ST48_9ASCO|nr:hypothetical protein CANARDRAFT_204750 [[Candida] arabinofermentans NRRL YB-2248]